MNNFLIISKKDNQPQFFSFPGEFTPDKEKAFKFVHRPEMHLANVKENLDKEAEIVQE